MRASASRRSMRVFPRMRSKPSRCRASPAISVPVLRHVLKQSALCALAESATLVRLAFAREAVCRASTAQAGLFAAASMVATLLYHSLVFHGTEERLEAIERRRKHAVDRLNGAEHQPWSNSGATEAGIDDRKDGNEWRRTKLNNKSNELAKRTAGALAALAAGVAWLFLPVGMSMVGLITFAGGSAILRGRMMAEIQNKTVAFISCASFAIQSTLVFFLQCSGQLMNDRWISTAVAVAACAEFVWLWKEQPPGIDEKVQWPGESQRGEMGQDGKTAKGKPEDTERVACEAPEFKGPSKVKDLWHHLPFFKDRLHPLLRCTQFLIRAILLVEVSTFLISYVAHLDVPNIQTHQMLQPFLSVQAVLSLGFLRASHAALGRLRVCGASANSQRVAFESWLISSLLLTVVVAVACAIVSLGGPAVVEKVPLVSLLMLMSTSHSVLEGCIVAQGNMMNALVPLAGSTGMMMAFTALRGEANQNLATFQIAFAIFHSHLWLRYWLHCRKWQSEVSTGNKARVVLDYVQ